MRREGLAELMWDEARVARRWSARSAELPPKGCLSRVPFGQVKEQGMKVRSWDPPLPIEATA